MQLKLTLLCMTLLTLIGCNKTDEQVIQNQKKKTEVVSATKVKEVKEVKEVKDKQLVALPSIVQPSTKRINGTKFELLNGKFEKGADVYNLVMNEFGTIKGSFVIVVKDKVQMQMQDFDKTDEIAQNTYRIWPNSEQDFSAYYQELKDNKNITTVEVDIDYSPKSKSETY